MMVIGIDAHKRSHTAVTIDENGRQGSTKTVGTTTQDCNLAHLVMCYRCAARPSVERSTRPRLLLVGCGPGGA